MAYQIIQVVATQVIAKLIRNAGLKSNHDKSVGVVLTNFGLGVENSLTTSYLYRKKYNN